MMSITAQIFITGCSMFSGLAAVGGVFAVFESFWEFIAYLIILGDDDEKRILNVLYAVSYDVFHILRLRVTWINDLCDDHCFNNSARCPNVLFVCVYGTCLYL